MFGDRQLLASEVPNDSAAQLAVLDPSTVWPVVRLFQLTAADVVRASGYAPGALLIRRVAAPLAFACITSGFVTGYYGWSTGLLHLCALYLIAERLRLRLKAQEVAAAMGGPVNPRRVSINAEQIVLDEPTVGFPVQHRSTVRRWSEWSSYYTSPDCVVLVGPHGEPSFLPRVWFSVQEYSMLLGQLASRVPRARIVWWGVLRPIVVVMVLLLSWLAWSVPR